MRRYFIKLSYDGSSFHGWQIQDNAHTVQEAIQDALGKLLAGATDIIGCGRTDTGVHAREFYAHFDTQKQIEPAQICYKLNKMLPQGIAIHEVFEVNPEAHARFSALSRTYHYQILQEKDPFLLPYSYLIFGKEYDLERMNEVTQELLVHSDFTSFSKTGTQVKTNNCKIFKAQWQFKGRLLLFEIKADRFLRNMVRAITGSLLEIEFKGGNANTLREIIVSKDRSAAGYSVPAQGLYLQRIEYNWEEIRI